MAGLAEALVQKGCRVTYVAEELMSADRVMQGWITPLLTGVELRLAADKACIQNLVSSAGVDVVHICQGIRSNGLVSAAQRALAIRGAQQWVLMETVKDAVWYGAFKRAEYKRLFDKMGPALQGVLATGHSTPTWVAERGFPSDLVFPFAYFLPTNSMLDGPIPPSSKTFKFIFAGRLISLKRVDWLIEALGGLADQSFELNIVGSGPDEGALRALASRSLRARVRWLGQLPSTEVPRAMAQADCLVLPSIHDGWGAVASESLMVGTPVVCSDACGVAGVVQSSAVGGVFPVNDRTSLTNLLAAQLSKGIVQVEARHRIAEWATCLGAVDGARYLQEILTFKDNMIYGVRPVAPWDRGFS